MATARDGCVVETEPLSAMLQGFVGTWNRDRPRDAGRFGPRQQRVDVSPVGAVRWLSQETGLPEPTIENVVRKRYRVTELRVADALVTALGRPEVFHDGTLAIRPNPSASRAARATCCGSLTGDAARR